MMSDTKRFTGSGRRICRVVDAFLRDKGGGSDACYDLVDKSGTPEEVGSVVMEELGVAELSIGASHGITEHGGKVTMVLVIEIEGPPRR